MTDVTTEKHSDLLFHYTSARTALEHILPSRRLRFSQFETLRDPIDGHAFDFTFEQSPVILTDHPESTADQPITRTTIDLDRHEYFNRATLLLKEKMRIACFSQGGKFEGEVIPPMWEFYGGQYSGCCLVFDRAMLIAALKEQLQGESLESFHVDSVNYVDRLSEDKPELVLDEDRIRAVGLERVLEEHVNKYRKELFFTKLSSWKFEQEIRFIFWDNVGHQSHFEYGDALKEVVVGQRFVAPGNRNYLHRLKEEQGWRVARLIWENGVFSKNDPYGPGWIRPELTVGRVRNKDTDLALDLSKVDPRSMEAKLDGYEWLPRMIDKARAYTAGTLGDYYKYPCPIDSACLEKIGINSESFARIATGMSSDEEVLAELKKRGMRSAQEVAFDPVGMNERFHKGGS